MVIAITTFADKHAPVTTRFGLQVGANIGAHSASHRSGTVKSIHHFLAYSLVVRNDADEAIFDKRVREELFPALERTTGLTGLRREKPVVDPTILERA